MTRRLTLSLLLPTLAFLGVGCGSQGEVSGKVTFEGKSVQSGTVMIVGEDGQPRYGTIDSNGNYAIADVPRGEAKVAVNSPQPGSQVRVSSKDSKSPSPANTPPPEAATWFPLPKRYADPLQSGLTLTVSGGSVPFDIELKRGE